MKKEPSYDNSFYIIGLCCIGVILTYIILRYSFKFDVFDYIGVCTFYRVMGYYCPGCGGTRAVFALFRGEIWEAFMFHPFVPYIGVVGGWFMISQTIERISMGKIKIAMHFRMIYVWAAIIIIFANFIWKNAVLFFTGNALI